MGKQLEHDAAFDEFAASLFRLTRTLRSTQGLWVQLPGGLKRSDVTILKLINELGECRPGTIADRLGVGPSVISRQLTNLDDEQLISRRRDPEDGRAELIVMTELGGERLAAMRAAYVLGMQEHFTDWTDERARTA
ncbi:MAG TPA: MarR family transcriptional regulator, partial [Nocardioides sp.]